MKSLLKRFLISLLLPFILNGEGQSFDDILASPSTPSDTVLPTFFQLDGRTDWISDGSVQTQEFVGIPLGFQELDTRFSYVYPCQWAMIATSVGYQGSWLKLGKTPFFTSRNFDNLYATLGGRVFKGPWMAQGEFQFNVDIDRGTKNGALYFIGGWATYSFIPSFSTSLGILGRSGIRQNIFWPVGGFDWLFAPKWELHAVFPTNVALAYRPFENFTFSLTTRFINSRHRLRRQEFLASGIFEYRNAGEEFGITYTLQQFLNINVHAGWMFRGDLKIETSNGDDVIQLKSDGSYYIGGNFFLRF